MSFADLVGEVRQLPIDEKVELQHLIDRDLSERIVDELHASHLDAIAEYEAGKLKFTSDPAELIRWLETE